MKQPVNYITTWFYRESKEEASFYPQLGQKGNSSLVHSIYMQIQVPFFVTFKHYNPDARYIFFTNLTAQDLPDYLTRLFRQLEVEVISLPYTCKPPKDWYPAWQNQFYLYDILKYMGKRMEDGDTLLVSDADCLCHTSLSTLFEAVQNEGSALYEFITDRKQTINGITLPQMEEIYRACYETEATSPITYYGGEFVAFRKDIVDRLNTAFPELWTFNLQYGQQHPFKLNEEAHLLSLLAEHLHIRNATANRYVKRLWTTPHFNNVQPGDENLPVWHLPYEKKRGLYYLYKQIGSTCSLTDESAFWKKAGYYTGIPHVSLRKRLKDRITTLWMKFK